MKKILIIEDKRDFYELLERNLSPYYDISITETAEEGIEKLNLKPDLVILDMSFPKKKGGIPKEGMWLEVLEKIKEYGIKTIVVGSPEIDCEDVIKMGAFKCIPKIKLTESLKELLDAIKEALGEDYEK